MDAGGDALTTTVSLTEPAPATTAAHSELSSPFRTALRPDRLVVAGLLVFGCLLYLTQSRQSDVPDHGDWWTDMAIIDATRRINELGPWATRLALPLDDGTVLGTDQALYANWPTAPFLLQALAYKTGLQPRHVRVLPILETMAAGYMLFCLARFLAGAPAGRFALGLFLTAAPVRLLADSFGYVPVDLLARCSAFGVVAVTASIDPARSPRVWRAGLVISVLVIAANAVVGGFESFPAACIFAAGYPLLRGRWRAGRRGIGTTLAAALGVPATALALAVSGRLAAIAILPGPFVEDYRQVRTSAEARFVRGYFGVRFWDEWSLRLRSYVAVLVVLTVVAAATALVWALWHRRWRPLGVGALIVAAEGAWIVTAQQHSQRHVHTVALFMVTLTLPAGWLCGLIASKLRTTLPRGKVVVAVLAAAGFGFLLTNPGLRSYGNVVSNVDWRAEQFEVDQLRAALSADAVVTVSASIVDRGPAPLFFLQRRSFTVPHHDLSAIMASHHVVYLYRRDAPDPITFAALASGATVVVRSERYEVLDLPPGPWLPPELDPDG